MTIKCLKLTTKDVIVLVACLFTLCIVLATNPHYSYADFEKPGLLKPEQCLPPDLARGAYHKVTEVRNDGFINHYIVESSFGTFHLATTSSLQILIKELHAIAIMKEIETDDKAIESIKKSGHKTVAGLKHMFNSPQGTLKNATSSVGKLFNRAKATVGKRETTSSEDSKIQQLIGFSKSKGQIANKYGVNVYSYNKVLQHQLDRLAWADYLGGLSMGAATSSISGLGGALLTTSGTARLLTEAINTTPASKVWVQNKEKLTRLKINEDSIELFLNNPDFSPSMQSMLVAALDIMKDVENLELYIKVALQAHTPAMARIITESAIMTAGYHTNFAPLKRLVPVARLARGETEDGSIIVLLPSDYIIWGNTIAEISSSLIKGKKVPEGAGYEIWSRGSFSDKAEIELKKMGWNVHAQVIDELLPQNK